MEQLQTVTVTDNTPDGYVQFIVLIGQLSGYKTPIVNWVTLFFRVLCLAVFCNRGEVHYASIVILFVFNQVGFLICICREVTALSVKRHEIILMNPGFVFIFH